MPPKPKRLTQQPTTQRLKREPSTTLSPSAANLKAALRRSLPSANNSASSLPQGEDKRKKKQQQEGVRGEEEEKANKTLQGMSQAGNVPSPSPVQEETAQGALDALASLEVPPVSSVVYRCPEAECEHESELEERCPSHRCSLQPHPKGESTSQSPTTNSKGRSREVDALLTESIQLALSRARDIMKTLSSNPNMVLGDVIKCAKDLSELQILLRWSKAVEGKLKRSGKMPPLPAGVKGLTGLKGLGSLQRSADRADKASEGAAPSWMGDVPEDEVEASA